MIVPDTRFRVREQALGWLLFHRRTPVAIVKNTGAGSKSEEILIRGAGFGSIACQRVRAS
jgi:hypothetical protein